jgi:voltage-gated potassium channel
VIVRIFDEDFAHALQEQFGFIALSATEMAAPIFAAAASGVDVTNPISVEGESLSLARLTIAPKSILAGKTVGQVEDGYSVSIVLVRHDHTSELHPTDSLVLKEHDLLAVLGRPEKLNALVHANQ